jgi:hypothetical protein
MTKPSTITQWLQKPGNITDKDRQANAALIKAYPYFVPARFVEAAEHHHNQPFSTAVLNRMRLYMGNWLLFHEYLQTSSGAVAPVFETEEVEAEAETRNHAAYMPAPDAPKAGYIDENQPEDEFEDIDDLEDEEDTSFDGSADIDDEVWGTDFDDEEETDSIIPEEQVSAKSSVTEGRGHMDFEEEELATADDDEEETESVEEEVKIVPAAKEEVKSKEKSTGSSPKQQKDDGLIQPLYTEDYFLHQGIPVSDKIPAEVDHIGDEKAKSLMVVMSFSEWLVHFKTKGEREKEEHQDQKALKTMWQKEKLAAALEEENEEIPENVFEMAVNSIAKEDDLISESLAEIMVKQEKYEKAIDMYRKLSLRNPQKNAYFARKIDKIQKEKDS